MLEKNFNNPLYWQINHIRNLNNFTFENLFLPKHNNCLPSPMVHLKFMLGYLSAPSIHTVCWQSPLDKTGRARTLTGTKCSCLNSALTMTDDVSQGKESTRTDKNINSARPEKCWGWVHILKKNTTFFTQPRRWLCNILQWAFSFFRELNSGCTGGTSTQLISLC